MTTEAAQELSAEDVRFAQLAKALAHPARVAIVRLLLRLDCCVCGQIVDKLPLAQSTVSQHLKHLKEAGLVVGTIDGPRTCYCLDKAVIRELRQFVANL